jgi:hypothetical protein
MIAGIGCSDSAQPPPGADAPPADDDPPSANGSQTGSGSGSADPGLSSTLAVGTTLVTTADVNLHSGPGTAYSILEVIPAGTRVSTVEHTSPSSGFYNILSGPTVGWSSGLYLAIAIPPAAHMLDTSVVKEIVEPPGSGDDDHGNYFSDQNYWNFCGPGAVTALLSYFNSHVTTWPAGYFREPYGPHVSDTYWTSSDTISGYRALGRAYLMHIAMQVRPPDFTSAGLAHFASYPTTGANLQSSRDVLNWEASGHSSGWRTFFYVVVSASGLSASTLHRDVKRDIYGGHAVLATVNTAYLPNWSRGLGHSIAIVGYDDNAGTYAYVDTCGKRCNGASQATNGGVWHVAQSRMYSAIVSHGTGYAR